MLFYLLPYLVLSHITLTISTSPDLLVPRGLTIHAANEPICLDGLDLRLEELSQNVFLDCGHMWRSHLKPQHGQLKEQFYHPDNRRYPFYFYGAPGGCGFRIEEPPGRRILEPSQARENPQAVQYVEKQIAMGFGHVLSQCVNRHFGGILIFEKTSSTESMKFVLHVGAQQVSPPNPAQVKNIYDGPEGGGRQ